MHERFPDRVNSEFIRVIDRRHLQMRVWERGSGETWACGTGATASAVASLKIWSSGFWNTWPTFAASMATVLPEMCSP